MSGILEDVLIMDEPKTVTTKELTLAPTIKPTTIPLPEVLTEATNQVKNDTTYFEVNLPGSQDPSVPKDTSESDDKKKFIFLGIGILVLVLLVLVVLKAKKGG